ncbi:hypothetical protein ACFQ5N_09490 [Lutibacter holmesii]|uniref:Outer membrane protein beta-barrel domain-containing protein n=1 Tax=Lutibacter holmesii TaxID=1137985 RepID=A0ABW3WS02_9FLAO
MKKLLTLLLFSSILLGFSTSATAQEDYTALNLYVSFGDNAAINAQYEIPIMENVTISPSVVVPFDFDNLTVGARADYYFDSLMSLPEPWDIWGGVDTGFVLGGDDAFNINAHVGVEYKLSKTLGIIAEFGGGTASFGGFGVGLHF